MSCEQREIERASQTLRAGGLVAFPTETVYGLGVDAANPDALRRLFAVKGRPPSHPVIVHLARPAELTCFARDVPPVARRLAEACWPGPLTLVLYRDPRRIAPEATGGLDTVGLRVPDHPVALALLERVERPVAAPSANRFGRVSPTTASDVRTDLGADVDVVLDGGPCRIGVESTIVDCTEPEALRVLRVGGVTVEDLTAILGYEPRIGGATRASGTLPVHYAPRARVELVEAPAARARAEELLRADGARPTVGLLGLEALPVQLPRGVIVLDPVRDVRHFARVLYSRLRAADRLRIDVLLVIPPPPHGLGLAVRDRLSRASRAGQ